MQQDHELFQKVIESLVDEGTYVLDKRKNVIYYWQKGLRKHDDAVLEELVPVSPVNGTLNASSPPTTAGPVGDASPVLVLAKLSPVRNTTGKVIGAIQVFTEDSEFFETEKRLREVERLALLDPLTTLGNRRYAEIHLQRSIDELRRYQWPFGVFFVDVDRFKELNDSFGHKAGDQVLQSVGRSIAGGLRSSDLVSRWGGDEFLVIVRNIEERQINPIGEKIRSVVEASQVATEFGQLQVTVSVGGTTAREDDEPACLFERVDRLMYESKCNGRNQVSTDCAAPLRDSDPMA